MNPKKTKKLQLIVTLFVLVIIIFSAILGNYLLTLTGILIGVAFLTLTRLKTKTRIDERESTIREKATRTTYMIFSTTIGITALLLLLPAKVETIFFGKEGWLYAQSIGIILAGITLFLIAIFTITYFIFSKKFGGSNEE